MQSPYAICEPDGGKSSIQSYKKCRLKWILTWTGYILTGFLLRLIFHWFPNWRIKATHVQCSFDEADLILVKDSSNVYFFSPVQTIRLPKFEDTSMSVPVRPRPDGSIRYFVYKQMKYIYVYEDDLFVLLPTWDEGTLAGFLEKTKIHLTGAMVLALRTIYEANETIVPITPILKLFLKEGLNPFYLFQVLSCILWFIDDYYLYASCIVILSLTSLIWEIYETRKNEKALHNTVCSTGHVSVMRDDGLVELTTDQLVPGDLIQIPLNGCTMYCDALLLTGNCIVNESTLTGESVPVTKTSFPVEEYKSKLRKLDPIEQATQKFDLDSASRSVLYSGTVIIQTRNFANEPVIAMVARTGFLTARGELIRGIMFPKPIQFQFNKDAFHFVLFLAGVAGLGFCLSVYMMVSHECEWFKIVKRSLDLITVVVPPALPVAMTVGVVFAQRRLKKKQLYCVHPSVINLCGVIDVTCFDKTGTITEDGLDMYGVLPVEDNGSRFAERCAGVDLSQGPLVEAMAACHSLTRINGELSGDPLDLKMFQSINWEFDEEVPEDHCKFEMTVPVVVRPKVSPVQQTTTMAYEVGILRQFPFSSSLQCMSVIARVLNQSHYNVYCKGSPEKLETLCRKDTIPSNFHQVLLDYTREGYRVLALAWRPLKVTYPRALKIPREEVERKLQFVGLLIMENRLKPESAGVILNLKQANIRPIMVTGDNMLTALSVARDCEMIEEHDRVIVVSAKPPPENTQQILFDNMSGNQTAVTGWEDLVEFHYAEDLQRPVMEVTATAHSRRGPSKSTAIRKSSGKSRRRSLRDTEQQAAYEQQDASRLSRVARWKSWFRFNKDSTAEQHLNQEVNYGSVRNGDEDVSVSLNQSNTEQTSMKPRLTIRMLDYHNFHLALSGKTWSVIMEHFPSLIPKLVVKGTVFARFSPDQKKELIEALQSVGYYVSMCGDGANDCGALKAAHAGVSLSEAEASVASHFTSHVQNISCIPLLIREGRCALATSFGIFKFMTGYSLTQCISVILFHSIAATFHDRHFLYIDLFLITTLSISFSYTHAYPKLTVNPPTMRLFSMVTISSLGLQLMLNAIFQLSAFLYIQTQEWNTDRIYRSANCSDESDSDKYNYAVTSVFMVSAYQYIWLAIVFAKGAPYRKNIFSNKMFLANLAITLIMTMVLTVYPIQPLLDFMYMMRLREYESQLIFLLMISLNFLLAYLFEYLVDGMAFRRQMRKIRRILFPRKVQRKDYERIREEIERMAGDWPPLIRSASVQDIRADLFHGHQPAVQSRIRHVSSCTEEDSDNMHSPISNQNAGSKFTFDNQTSVIPTDQVPMRPVIRRSRSLNPEEVTMGPLQKVITTPSGNGNNNNNEQNCSEEIFPTKRLEFWRRRSKSSDAKHILNEASASVDSAKFFKED